MSNTHLYHFVAKCIKIPSDWQHAEVKSSGSPAECAVNVEFFAVPGGGYATGAMGVFENTGRIQAHLRLNTGGRSVNPTSMIIAFSKPQLPPN